GAVVVHPYRCAPRPTVIVGVANVDVHVVALVLLLQRVDQVRPTAVRAAGPVPSQPWLSVDRAVRLGGYEVETAHVGVGYEDAVLAELGWAQTIGIDVHIDLAAALAAFCQCTDLHHLAVGANGDVSIGAIISAANDFRRDKASHLTQSGYGRTSSD